MFSGTDHDKIIEATIKYINVSNLNPQCLNVYYLLMLFRCAENIAISLKDIAGNTEVIAMQLQRLADKE